MKLESAGVRKTRLAPYTLVTGVLLYLLASTRPVTVTTFDMARSQVVIELVDDHVHPHCTDLPSRPLLPRVCGDARPATAAFKFDRHIEPVSAAAVLSADMAGARALYRRAFMKSTYWSTVPDTFPSNA